MFGTDYRPADNRPLPYRCIPTIDAIFTVRQMQEKHGNKGNKLYYASVDLEEAFDRVPREVIRRAVRKAGVEEWLACSHGDVRGAQRVVRTAEGDSEGFKVKVALQQGSVLRPMFLVIVMEVITKELRIGLPWKLLYADDLILMAESETELREKIVKWKAGMEAKGLKMNWKNESNVK